MHSETVLAAHVVKQALLDLDFRAADRRYAHRDDEARMRKDAADFLLRRLWKDENVWGGWLILDGGGVSREALRARVLAHR